MKKWWIAAPFLLAACSGTEEAAPSEEVQQAAEEAEVVAESLATPWSIESHGDVIYIAERDGSVMKIEDGTQTRQSVELDEPLAEVSEAGLLGFVLDPEFNETNEAFAYYTYGTDTGAVNRLVKLTLSGDTWQESAVLLDDLETGNIHHGGRLAIGPDDRLYIAVGDAAEPDLAQDEASLNGKILRLELDGGIPADNPFGTEVYSIGHRNPQGMAWDDSGRMFATEHGQSGLDEVNEIEPGGNYGWPVIEGDEEEDGMITPLVHSGSPPSWAPSGAVMNNGVLYFATLRGESVKAYDIQDGTVTTIAEEYGRIRDVAVINDALYFITNNTDGRGNPEDNDDRLIRMDLPDL